MPTFQSRSQIATTVGGGLFMSLPLLQRIVSNTFGIVVLIPLCRGQSSAIKTGAKTVKMQESDIPQYYIKKG